MKYSVVYLSLLCCFFLACTSESEIVKLGKHYQKHQDYKSLQGVLDLMPLDADTSYIQLILGEPIDMGFDYRYTIDSVGENGCTIGAVFHLDDKGGYDQKWLDEICE